MQKLFASKRGTFIELVMNPILVTLIVIVGVLLPTLLYIHRVSTNSAFQMDYLSRDMGLLIDVLYASRGNTQVDYNQDTFWFTLDFNKNEVVVIDETEPIKLSSKYFFTEDSGIIFRYNQLTPIFEGKADKKNMKEKLKLKFARIGNELIVDKKEAFFPDINRPICYKPKSGVKISSQKILIDPWIANRNGFDESELTADIGFAFKVRAGQKTDVISTRIESLEGKWLGRTENYLHLLEDPTTSIIIGIHTGIDDDKAKNDIKAYISSDSPKSSESSSLACYILNEILDKVPAITGATIMPIDTALPENKEAKQMLGNDKISVLLEIGNIKIEQNNVLLDKNNNDAIGAAIYGALEKYYN